MPATRRASAASSTEQQPCLFFAADGSQLSGSASTPLGEPRRRNAPTTSYPWRSNSAAATELSTPPPIATTTFSRKRAIGVIVGQRDHSGDACVARFLHAAAPSPPRATHAPALHSRRGEVPVGR